MVAVSVLETMLVMFLMDFEGFSCFYKKAENCENAKTDVQLEPMEGNLFFWDMEMKLQTISPHDLTLSLVSMNHFLFICCLALAMYIEICWQSEAFSPDME